MLDNTEVHSDSKHLDDEFDKLLASPEIKIKRKRKLAE